MSFPSEFRMRNARGPVINVHETSVGNLCLEAKHEHSRTFSFVIRLLWTLCSPVARAIPYQDPSRCKGSIKFNYTANFNYYNLNFLNCWYIAHIYIKYRIFFFISFHFQRRRVDVEKKETLREKHIVRRKKLNN